MKFFGTREGQPSRRNGRLWRRRVLRGGLTLLLLGGVLGGGAYGWQSGAFARTVAQIHDHGLQTAAQFGFRVDDILVTGRNRADANDLIAHLDLREGMPIFTVDIAAAQERLKQISWVKTVRVSRRLPNKIVVTLEERQPAALWQYKQKISVIDSEGVALTSDDLDAYAGLPLLVGEDAPKHVTELSGLLRAEPTIAQELSSAVRVGARRWDLHMKNGLEIRLPENDVEFALRKLAQTSESEGLFAKNIGVIDLRIPEKLTVETLPEPADTADAGKPKNNI